MFINIYCPLKDKLIELIKFIEHYQMNHDISIYYFIYHDLNNLDKHIALKDSDMFIFVDDGSNRLISYLNNININNVVFYSVRNIDFQSNIKWINKIDKLYDYLDFSLNDNKPINDTFIVKTKDGYKRISYSSISYIELINKHACFYLYNGSSYISNSLRLSFGEYLKELLNDNRFIRCHSAFVINIDYVNSLSKNNFIMKDNSLIPISNKRLNDVTNKYLNY